MALRIKSLLPFIIFFGLLLLYLHNLSRSVYGGDVGDFVSASFVMGVPHPPGFPLFTLLGFLLTKLPLGLTPAFKVGLISVFSGALGALFYFKLAQKNTKIILISLLSTLVLAFSYLYWLHSEIAEVFGLNNLFIILLFYFAYSFHLKGKIRDLLSLAFLSGLSLMNHQTIVLIFPSLLILSYVNLIKIVKKNPKILIASILLFLSAFLVYGYVFIASSRSPVINWDNVHDLKSFLRLILRKDYGTFNAGLFVEPNFAQRIVSFKVYLKNIVSNVTFPVFALSIIGLLGLLRKDLKFCISILIGFILIGPVFVTYSGFPLTSNFFIGIYERFFTASIIVLLLAFPYGLYFSIEKISKYLSVIKNIKPWVYGVFFIIPALLFLYNYPKLNLSHQYEGDNLGYDILRSVPEQNAVLILSGDTAYFNTEYVRYALGFRKDIQLINLNDISTTGFFKFYEAKYQKNNNVKNDRDIIIHVLKFASKETPVYSYVPILSQKKDEIWVPYGMAYKLTDKVPPQDQYKEEINKLWSQITFPSTDPNELTHQNLTISEFPLIYSEPLIFTGAFLETRYSDNSEALKYYMKAYNLAPDYSKTNKILGLYYLSLKKCTLASNYFRTAIDNDTLTQLNYYLLYATYKDCSKDNVRASELLTEYKNVFGTDLISDVQKSLKRK